MEDVSQFEAICPYSDEEAAKALAEISRHPAVPVISKALFPEEKASFLADALRSINSIDEFQTIIMSKAVDWCLDHTVHNFSYDGVSNLKAIDGKFLMMSNHRDIILDPAITQYVLLKNGIPMSEICVGDNLLSEKVVEKLLRSNRMIKVIRGISARELYLSSQLLSKYIRQTITSGKSSVWIAQRQGRTKDGVDITEQGLLKMFDMSGTGTFEENFRELNIVPMSISYEYESCDARKAREVLLRREGPYIKKEDEDLHSILTGIRQAKGHIHLEIEEPLTAEEIFEASKCEKNDRYQSIRHLLDRRIIAGYKLWKTNYMAHDLLNDKREFAEAGKYTEQDLAAFEKYIGHKLGKLERRLDRAELRKIFLGIYAGPVDAKQAL